MTEEGKENTSKSKKDRKPILLIAIILVVLIIIALGAFYFLKSSSSQKSEISQDKTNQSQSVLKDQNVHLKNLSSMIINLANPSGDRYVKISLSLVLNGKEKAKASESNGNSMEDAIIKNAIITVVSTKTSDSLLTISGKEALKKQLIKAINDALGEDAVKDIYFTDFIVQ